MEEIPLFLLRSFHVFLFIFILVGWAVLPKKDLILYLITIWTIPTLWVVYDDCIVTNATNILDPPEETVTSALQDIGKLIGIKTTSIQSTGIALLIIGVITFLASKRLLT